MPITLASLVQQPALGLTVLAAPAALDREITWVHTSELVDPTPYLEGGELLLSVGLWLARGRSGGQMRPPAKPPGRSASGPPSGHRPHNGQIGTYVERLVRAGVSGLGFGTGLAHETVPPALVEAAASRGLPVIEVPRQTPFIALSRTVWESLAADQYAEVTRTSQAQQELTRAAVASGSRGLVSRLAERLGAWVVLLDAAGSVQHAAPAGAAREGPWLARELDRLRDVTTPVSTTLSVDGEQIMVQSVRPAHRTRAYLAVGMDHRPTPEQRNMLNTAVSLLTLMLAQATALRTAESRLRTTVFDLLVNGDVDRASHLAAGLWGGLPSEPVRALLVAATPPGSERISEHRMPRRPGREAGSAGSEANPEPTNWESSRLDDLVEVVDATAAVAAERVFFAQLADRVSVVYAAGGGMRDRLLAACCVPGRLTAGESTDAQLSELGRAHREAEQALDAGLRAGRAHTSFADIGGAGLLGLLTTPQAAAFAQSLLRPLLRHDASARGDLIRSLHAWLEHNGQWDTAAAALGVHRHTLRNRMRRVGELLGRDLDVAAVRVELWAAVQLLNGPGPGYGPGPGANTGPGPGANTGSSPGPSTGPGSGSGPGASTGLGPGPGYGPGPGASTGG